jgi:hypothetical protein
MAYDMDSLTPEQRKRPARGVGEGDGAVLSSCGKYRYHLWRTLGDADRVATFIMLNPSTADAKADDPTIRRCIGFARREGVGLLQVVNLFAYRATRPQDMRRVADPVGPDNRRQVETAALIAWACDGPVICAWGVEGRHRDQDRAVMGWLKELGVPTLCLGVTAGGDPRHPLYLSALEPLRAYKGRP